ncbi:MAG TPA: pyridoxal phosphate-dependent aminotransferase [Gemmatimonadaceae bacterium]|nr:pyridoxal phosphate-dependent aminotransferase [Gemmatimonadaceae bacterium]
MQLSERVERLTNEGAFEVLAAATRLEREGRDIVHLELGQPDFPTPPHIVEAGVRALRDGHVKYAPPAGIPALRAAIAEHLRRRGDNTSAENVVITPGGKSAIYSTMLALIDEGTEVLTPDLGFSAYEAITRFAGGIPRFYQLDPARGFRPGVEELAERCTPRTRVLVLNAPHNPTGGTLERADLEDIADFAQRNDLTVISDEIYAGLQFDARFQSIHSLPGMAERTAIVDGFSKSYAMTGWRLGYAVLPRRLVDPLVRLATNSFSCTATFIQHAGVAALTGSQECVREMRAEYSARARLATDALNAIPGITCCAPAGAFYVFPDVRELLPGTGSSSAGFANDLLHGYGVACLSGAAFGPAGEGYLRISCANSRANIALGIKRIQRHAAAVSAAAA